MFAVSEKGLFLKPNYQLKAEYDEGLSKEKQEFLLHLEEWNRDPDRFLPEKVCALFSEMNRLQVERKGSLGKRECCLCGGIEGIYTEDGRAEFHLKGISGKLAEGISLVNGNHAVVNLDGVRHYVFMEEAAAAAWRKLKKSYEISPSGWLEEAGKFLRRQAYSREVLAESFFRRQLPIYLIRPGFREAGEFLEPYYFGISLSGFMDNFFLTLEEYMELYRTHYMENTVMLNGKLCIMNFAGNLKFLEKLYQHPRLPNSAHSRELLKDEENYALGEDCRWMKRVYVSCRQENKPAIVRENMGKADSLLVLAHPSKVRAWRESCPQAMVHTPETLIRDLEDSEGKLEFRPAAFVWDEAEIDWDSCSYLKFLLRFCSVSREFLFFSRENLPSEQELEKMEEIFYISGLKKDVKAAVQEAGKRRDVCRELLFYTKPKEADEALAGRISRQEHIFWVQEHPELYQMPEKEAELFRRFKAQEKVQAVSLREREIWYENFVQRCENNLFMYKNGVHTELSICSSAFGAYFLPVGDTAVPLGFLQEAQPDWKIRQRRRICQWLEDQREDWERYLKSNFMEFRLEGGEELKKRSEEQTSADLETLTNLLFDGARGSLEADENSMYAGLERILDIL